jgi:hypothetical protein
MPTVAGMPETLGTAATSETPATGDMIAFAYIYHRIL